MRTAATIAVTICLKLSTVMVAFIELIDTVGWASERAFSLKKLSDEVLMWLYDWGGKGCLHMVQLMPLPSRNLIISCLS